MRLTLSDVKQALDYGVGPGGDRIVFSGVSTDTRTLQPGDLFVALRNREVDGHQFIPQALRAGAAGLIVSQSVVASLDTPVLRVPDTEVAYGLLARFWRDKFDIPVIGVTGSVGKTTVKEMLAAALSPLGLVLKTPASQNNETGVPKTLLELTPEHKAVVVEMGMRGAGQIAYLCGIARPTVGVITVIGDNHLELLGSRQAIADAKGELFQSLPEDGVAILNADDEYYDYLLAKVDQDSVLDMSYGSKPGSVLCATEIKPKDGGWSVVTRGPYGEESIFALASPAKHDVYNALAALAAACAAGVSVEEAITGLQNYSPPPMRMQVTKIPSGVTILNDAYNAAPASVASALETLTAYAGSRKIAFLGDMRELGEQSTEAHRELGAVIAGLGGLDALYTVGGLAAQIPGAAQRFADSGEATRFAREALSPRPGDVILVKGSRAMAMERIVEALAAEAPPS